MDKFRFKKRLGQNFLRDKNILRKIVDEIDVANGDLIIEIGPGDGALTKELVALGCDCLAFEVDSEVKLYLDQINASNLRVIYQDFLTVDFSDYDFSKYNNVWIVANIPYYITTPIVEKVIKSNLGEAGMILMVQDEVADRFIAKAGSNDYGSITIYLNCYYDVYKLFTVPREAFYPVPKVDSAIVKFVPNKRFDVVDDGFLKFIRDSFQFKRKNIKNNLFKYDLDKISEVLEKYGHTLQSRAEEFSLDEFVDMYECIKK